MDPRDWVMRAFIAAADILARYHRHQIVHLARLRRPLRAGRRVVLVGNHALDIVDPLLLLASVYRELHRVPRFIGHENGWFRTPVLREISARFQIIPSRRPEEALAALADTQGAKVLAGGQSLVPRLSMRLAAPSMLVDINALPGLGDVTCDASVAGGVLMAALTRP